MNTSTVIPCPRPQVKIEPHEKEFHTGRVGDYYLVTCHVTGCTFTYDAAVVTDASYQATMHRQLHRLAVPVNSVERRAPGFVATCACGWSSYDGVPTSKSSVTTLLKVHLRTEHGVVNP